MSDEWLPFKWESYSKDIQTKWLREVVVGQQIKTTERPTKDYVVVEIMGSHFSPPGLPPHLTSRKPYVRLRGAATTDFYVPRYTLRPLNWTDPKKSKAGTPPPVDSLPRTPGGKPIKPTTRCNYVGCGKQATYVTGEGATRLFWCDKHGPFGEVLVADWRESAPSYVADVSGPVLDPALPLSLSAPPEDFVMTIYVKRSQTTRVDVTNETIRQDIIDYLTGEFTVAEAFDIT